MTLDIEEYRIIKTLKEVMGQALKAQRKDTQLAIDGWRDEKYKQEKIKKLERYKKAMEWLEKQ